MQEPLFQMPAQEPPSGSIDFQSKASLQGRLAHQDASAVIRTAGFDVIEENQAILALGVEINLIAQDQLGNKWLCEVTGAYQSRRPGLRRTDTVRKIIGTCQLLSRWGSQPFLLLTTHAPRVGSAGDKMLRSCTPQALFDVIVLESAEDLRRLRVYAERGPATGPLPGWWRLSDLEKVETLTGQSAEGGKVIEEYPHYLEWLIPSQDRNSKPIDPIVLARFTRDLLHWCSARNRGLLASSADGMWQTDEGHIIEERVKVVRTCSKDPIDHSSLEPFVERALNELDQDSAGYTVDGVFRTVARRQDGTIGHSDQVLRDDRAAS